MEPSTIYKDNQSCITQATNDGNYNGHLEVKCHVCREAVTNNGVKLNYCPRNVMIADTLTEPQGPQKFIQLRKLMPMANLADEQQ